MSRRSVSLKLDGFERVESASGTTLLRIAARGSAGAAPNGGPNLVIDDGSRVHRLVPLPGPPETPGLVRATYSAPRALLGQEGTAFGLELSDGVVMDLPQPTRMPGEQQPATQYALQELERRLRSEQERRSAAEAALSAERERADAVAKRSAAALARARHRAQAVATAHAIETADAREKEADVRHRLDHARQCAAQALAEVRTRGEAAAQALRAAEASIMSIQSSGGHRAQDVVIDDAGADQGELVRSDSRAEAAIRDLKQQLADAEVVRHAQADEIVRVERHLQRVERELQETRGRRATD